MAGFAQGGTQALARHLHQAEARDAPELDPGAVLLHGIPQPVLHLALVARRGHVDEVDDEEAAQVAQPELAGDLVGGLQVGVEGRLLDVRALGGPGRVDVDGGQGLGVVDNDRAPGRQPHLALEGRLDLALDLVTGEERHLVLVEPQLAQVVGHDLADEGLGLLVHLAVVDHDLADVGAQVVADGADDDVAFLIDQVGRLTLGGGLLDGGPELGEVVEIPLQLLDALADTGGADDEPHVLRDLKLAHGVAQF